MGLEVDDGDDSCTSKTEACAPWNTLSRTRVTHDFNGVLEKFIPFFVVNRLCLSTNNAQQRWFT